MSDITSTTNFVTRPMLVTIIDTIPNLSCYQSDKWSRKPIRPEGFQLIVKISYEGALRIDESLNTKPEDIDFTNGEIRLPETKTGKRYCRCAKLEPIKGIGKFRMISHDVKCHICEGTGWIRVPQFTTIPMWLVAELEAYVKKYDIKPKTFIFESPSFPGSHISLDFIYKYLPELTAKCGFNIYAKYKIRRIRKLYTHIFRKSKAKQMLKDGFTLGDVSRKLRHTDVRTTTTYILSEEEDLQRKERELEFSSFMEYGKQ